MCCATQKCFVIVLVSVISVRRVERFLIDNVRHVSGNFISLRTCASLRLHLFDRMKEILRCGPGHTCTREFDGNGVKFFKIELRSASNGIHTRAPPDGKIR
jgi:hypothetical protein